MTRLKNYYKQFEQKLHDLNDPPTKKAVAGFLIHDWNLKVEQGTKYGVDLICYRGDKIVVYAEVERRTVWQNEFPFKTLHIPERKRKFCFLDAPTIFFSCNENLQKAFWVKGQYVVESPIVQLDTRHSSHEPFFDVPLNRCRGVKL